MINIDTGERDISYKVDSGGTEEIISGSNSVAPIMDIHYGNNPTLENQEFMYRQTAGGTLVGESVDTAYIERIKGNTVAWNQLIDSLKNTTRTVNGINFVYDNNGMCTVSGTGTSSGGRTTNLTNNVYSIVQHHKYYVTAPFSMNTTIYVTDRTNNAYVTEFSIVKKNNMDFWR